MPKRHGCYYDPDAVRPIPVLHLRFDIVGLMYQVATSDYLSNPDISKRAWILYLHAWRTLRRFVFALDEFQQAVNAKGEFFSKPMDEWNDHRVLGDEMMIEVYASAIAHYFNILFDEVWRVAVFVLEPALQDTVADRGEFRRRMTRENPAAYAPISHYFEFEGRHRGRFPWFEMMFRKGEGVRQRLTHWTDDISIQAAQRVNEYQVTVQVYVQDWDGGEASKEIVSIFRDSLLSFCKWLDDVYAVLSQEVESRAKLAGINLPSDGTYRLWLPVYWPRGMHRRLGTDYLYMPLCDGSLPIDTYVSAPECGGQKSPALACEAAVDVDSAAWHLSSRRWHFASLLTYASEIWSKRRR